MVDFIRTNPTAEVMQREGARADQQRDAEEAAFMRRNQFEQANAADAAVRAGIGSYYAQQQPQAQPAAAPQQQPGMTPVTPGPAPAGATPGQTATAAPGAPPVTVTIGHPPAAPATAATAPQEPRPLPQGQDQGFGDAAPLPPEQAQATPATPAARPTAAPGRTGAPAVAAADGGYKPIISEMIKAPGTGTAAMSLFTADQHQRAELAKLDRQTRLDGMKEFLASVKDGDAQLARFTAKTYNLGVPEEFFSNRAHMMRASVAAKTAEHLFGKDNPQQTLAYVQGYLEAGPNATPDQASLSGLTKVKATGMGGKVAGHYVGDKNQVVMYDKHGNEVKPDAPLPKARPQKWQVAGAGGASVYEKKQQAYLKVHPGDEQGALDYASGKRTIPPQQLRNWVEAAVAREEGKRVRPFTPEERKQTRAYYEDAFGIQAGSSAPRAQPGGGAKPGSRPPLDSFNRTGAKVGAPQADDEEAE